MNNAKTRTLYLVSVIVPVYNVERYIEKCVRSLMTQDFDSYEIILIDDGSTDDSSTIIDKLAIEDSRIKILHKQNEGVSIARNTGIELSSGKFIMFVDGDDWVEPNYISYFYKLIKSNNCEIGMNISNYSISNTGVKGRESQSHVISSDNAVSKIYSDEIFVAVWNKIYSSRILQNIRFSPDIWYGEGMLFNIECLQKIDNVAICSMYLYHQTFNPDSAMRKFNIKSNYCGICSLWLQRAKWTLVTPEIEHQWRYHLWRFNISIIDGLIRSEQLSKNKTLYKECVANLRAGIFIPLKYEKNFKKKILWLCYFFAPMLMGKRSAGKFNNQMALAENELNV